jgi:hypothetical protein
MNRHFFSKAVISINGFFMMVAEAEAGVFGQA